MGAISRVRGREISYDERNEQWLYLDNGELVEPSMDRACISCGRTPLEHGEDPCLGHLGSVVSACCGHGVEPAYVVFDSGATIRGYFDKD